MLGCKEIKINLNGKVINIETGKIAKQAAGSIVVSCEGTIVLVTANYSKEPREGIDFFPLMVDYEEKFYAAGKIPGGFFKREGRPSKNAILTSRLIDRPLRPLFPREYRNDVQVIATVLSYDQKNLPDILAMIGASAALWVSDIPFLVPIGAVRIGLIENEFIINPGSEELGNSKLNLIIAGTKDSIIMMEGEAKEVPEEIILKAISIAQGVIKTIIEGQEKLADILGKSNLKEEKQYSETAELEDDYRKEIRNLYEKEIKKSICINEKKERENTLKNIFNQITEKLSIEGENLPLLKNAYDEICKEAVRNLIIQEKIRVDGRKLDEIRPISCETGVLPRVHGSALFTRGETQALAITTLGTIKDRQFIDTLEEESSERFYLHYNFPPFSVGEVRPRRGQSRREIGHGSLAEMALKAVIPSEEEFPYTIRIVSEILESNGSSSMASVCGGSLSLFDAGVPIKMPVAGVAMGLVKEDENVEILTDILGLEDHYGDMDFKAAGTSQGITAIQMDLKIAGISKDTMQNVLQRSKEARLYILEKMNITMSKPKENISTYAPKILIINVDPAKIGMVIGPSGKNIKKIIEVTGASIDIKDDGEIFIAATDEKTLKQSKKMIEDLVREAKVGETYEGKVTRTTNFGAFVEIFPGKEGLVHISKLSHKRIGKVEDVVKVNDNILVKCIGIDNQGRVDLRKIDSDENNIVEDDIDKKDENYD
ncbi:MAG TPA: polyribonucleotide nucleotidyltransferase [Candidatus Atribacteria bacterium]|nr:MAG: Polyribonucleotide nucleotidyltransferase [Atribacteria bacterium 34_128]HAJ33112.1 polyribonucleotide nucleotidyltransferase [Candidatus Atribacteria bacterium]